MLIRLAEDAGEEYGARGLVVDEVGEGMVRREDGGLGGSAAPEAEEGRGGSGCGAFLGELDLGSVDGVSQVHAALAVGAEAAEVGVVVDRHSGSQGSEKILHGEVALEAELGDGQFDVARWHSVVQDVSELLSAVGVVRETTQELADSVGLGVAGELLLHGYEGRQEDVHRHVVALVGELKDVDSQFLGYHCE